MKVLKKHNLSLHLPQSEMLSFLTFLLMLSVVSLKQYALCSGHCSVVVVVVAAAPPKVMVAPIQSCIRACVYHFANFSQT